VAAWKQNRVLENIVEIFQMVSSVSAK